jgi:aryl-alcohol dehydrogenase-like predicted oxidoreductase
VRTRSIDGVEVSEVGFGAMNLSLAGRPPDEDGVRTIHAALDSGMTLLDTADSYCIDDDDFHHNERLLGRALRERPGSRENAFIATKAGYLRPGGRWVEHGKPEHIKKTCEESLRALGVERIDLLQFHHPDPNVPFGDSVAAFADLQREGKARFIGLSNVSVEQLDAAQGIVEVVSVQNQYSPYVRAPEQDGVLDACTAGGIAFLPWAPFGSRFRAKELGSKDAFGRVAARRGVSPHQVVLAWMLARSPVIIPIPGAKRMESVLDCARAVDLKLTSEEIAELDASS